MIKNFPKRKIFPEADFTFQVDLIVMDLWKVMTVNVFNSWTDTILRHGRFSLKQFLWKEISEQSKRPRDSVLCSGLTGWTYTGCSLNIVFFRRFYYIFRTLLSLVVSVCTHARQVEHQRCSRTGRVQKIHKILRKKHNI